MASKKDVIRNSIGPGDPSSFFQSINVGRKGTQKVPQKADVIQEAISGPEGKQEMGSYFG